MAYHTKTGTKDTSKSIPLPRLARPAEISSYIKKVVNSSQYDYHQTEAFEVTQVLLNEPGNRGSVDGYFLNDSSQKILGDVVKPKGPFIITVPVVGEHVDVIEFNGQHYYVDIINRKGSINENSIPGAFGEYVKNTKYGETFEKKNVKPLEIGEGCVLFEGRFGQSVHFDGHNNVPSIKIRTNIDESDGDFTTENIDTDDSSIYLTSDGLKGKSFEGRKIEGKKILLKSDGIFIKGSGEKGEVRIIGDESINLNSDKIKIGNDADQPVVKGDELVKIIDGIVKAISDGANAFTTETGAGKTIQALLKLLPDTKKILSKKVKTV